MESGSMYLEILNVNWEEFQTKLKTLNKKAAKFGCAPITIARDMPVEVARSVECAWDDMGQPTKHKEIFLCAHYLTITLPIIKLAGWEFAAKIESLESGVNLIQTVPGYIGAIDQKFRSTGTFCEHCNTNRYRKDVFIVVETATGRQIQVGRNCLRNFTGHDPIKALGKLEWLNSISGTLGDEERYSSVRIAALHSPIDVLQVACAYATEDGFVSKAAADAFGDRSTSQLTMRHFGGYINNKDPRPMVEVAEADKERAGKIVAWIKAHPTQGESDYMINVITLVLAGGIDAKHFGLVVSAIASYARAMGESIRKEYKKPGSDSIHQGKIGERLRDLELAVESVINMGNNGFGTCYLAKMLDAAGNVYSWFSGNAGSMQEGDKIVVTGSVKDHKEYKNVKETQLTRVKWELKKEVA